ncbi:helix-turn-helix domain-containing protein [Rubrolithibacter danxiaensis]|uniref:helix-turn-helix domain-containing protein n=1 Tax=Rubrolithibacter danxiaensis TaxID=3390805 RepID=UPI003BF8BAF5
MEVVLRIPDQELEKLQLLFINFFKGVNLFPSAIEEPKSDRCYFNEALQITGLSKSKMYKLTAKGEIPCKQFGSKLVFSRKELMSWIESQTVIKHDHSKAILSLAESAIKKKGGKQ